MLAELCDDRRESQNRAHRELFLFTAMCVSVLPQRGASLAVLASLDNAKTTAETNWSRREFSQVWGEVGRAAPNDVP
jgi:hypothetical protein